MAKRILIIEDSREISHYLKLRLKTYGYEVLAAFDGEEGLEMAREQRPDLILLDIMLPKLDGFKLCRLLKFDKSYEHIPIIMLTARGQEKDVETAEQIAADAYVVKPFDWKMLQGLIEKMLTPGFEKEKIQPILPARVLNN
jgi:DNA-binding response OmpR family regulator